MMPLQPVIDGDLLPDRIVECWKKGSAKDLGAFSLCLVLCCPNRVYPSLSVCVRTHVLMQTSRRCCPSRTHHPIPTNPPPSTH